MKVFLLFIILFLKFQAKNLDIEYYVKSVQKQREKVDNKIINKTKNPFYKKSHKNRAKVKIKLEAIFNKQAKINSKWYAAGDKIYRYKIIKITKDEVQLISNKKNLFLKIDTLDFFKGNK